MQGEGERGAYVKEGEGRGGVGRLSSLRGKKTGTVTGWAGLPEGRKVFGPESNGARGAEVWGMRLGKEGITTYQFEGGANALKRPAGLGKIVTDCAKEEKTGQKRREKEKQ